MRNYYINRKGQVIHNVNVGSLCPYCSVGDVVVRKGRYNNFLACSHFPACGFTQQIKTNSVDELEKKADKYLRRFDR